MVLVNKYKLIEVEEAHSIKKRLDLLDDAYYIDRSVIAPNRGLNGEIGAYHSIGNRSLPKDILEDLKKIAPKKDLPLTQIVVNRYRIGDWIPPHNDDVGPAYCSTLHLEDSEEGLSYKGGLSKNKAGWVNEHPMNFIHWVEPAKEERYSIIFLYERKLS